MPITTPPTAPSRTDPTTFPDRADAWVAWQETSLVPQINALEANVNAREASAVAASNAAAAASSAAAAASSAAAAVVDATLWVSGTSYTLGQAVFDPVNFWTYRRAVAGAGTTRPGLDAVNWVQVAGTGNARTDVGQTFQGVQTFSSAPVVPDDSFTLAKLQDIPTATILGRSTAGTGDVEALTGAQATALLSAASETVSGRVELADATEAAAGTDGTRALSPLRLRDALAATGSAPIYACRAWVNFNGTGTVAIRASGNVSSITDNGVGGYTVNFATAMPDANYAFAGGARSSVQNPYVVGNAITPQAAASLTVSTLINSTTAVDPDVVMISVFR